MVDPTLLLSVGFVLIVGIYILTAVLYGVYTTELFPTEVRLRANGLCNMLGRGATVISPFIVLGLFKGYGVGGVLGLMIGLLVVQIIVVAIWGIETNRRGLEELQSAAVGASGARKPARAEPRSRRSPTPLPRPLPVPRRRTCSPGARGRDGRAGSRLGTRAG